MRPKAYTLTHRVADAEVPKLRGAILAAVARVQQETPVEHLAELWPRQSPAHILAAIPFIRLEHDITLALRNALLSVLQQSAQRHHDEAPHPVQKTGWLERLGFLLDLTNPRAISWAERHAAELVRELTDTSFNAVHQIIVGMFREGIDPQKAARLIRDVIGLDDRYAQAVQNYRRKLEEGDTPEERTEGLVGRYSQRLLRSRADMIARTESMTASNKGQNELWQQAADKGFLDKERARQQWIVTPDERLCDLCNELGDSDPVPLDTAWSTSEGVFFNPPAHPSCRCTMGLVFVDD